MIRYTKIGGNRGSKKRQVPRLPRSCEARAVLNVIFGTCSTMFIGRVILLRRDVGKDGLSKYAQIH